MVTFAQVSLEPGGLVAWVVVGLLAGALAGYVMKGGGYGVLGDILVGLVGAVVGGFVFGLLVHDQAGFLGSIVVAFLGACLLIAAVRFLAPGRSRL